MNAFNNVSELLTYQAQSQPDKVALYAPKKSWLSFLMLGSTKYESLTFAEIEQRTNHYAHTFLHTGLIKGDRVLVFVKPGLEFPIIVFALFRAGLVPVFIDPGMGVDSMLQCVESTKATALIGIPKIHHLRILKANYFASIKFHFVVMGRAINAQSFDNLLKKNIFTHNVINTEPKESLAAILFTSGGTGIPKGVLYTNAMFIDQAIKLKQLFKLTQQDKDYPCFPLFGLFSLALGLTVVLPGVDLMKPAEVNAKAIAKALIHHKITFSTGSPALWNRVSQYATRKKLVFTQLKVIATFGAPVNLKLHQALSKLLPYGDLYTPYGATECLPVSITTSREVLGDTKNQTLMGYGTCVGYAAPMTDIKILCLDQLTIVSPDDEAIGEIIVHSSTMTQGYDGLESSHIAYHCPVTNKKYHRMGDMGKIDHFGRLWFLGRVVHSIKVSNYWLCTEEIEPVVNNLPEVSKSALLNVQGKIILVVERTDGITEMSQTLKDKFFQKIRFVLDQTPKGHLVAEIVLDINFPVDTRHNIKIDRLAMAKKFLNKGLLSI